MKLESVNELREEIQRLNERIKVLRELSCGVSAPVLDGMPHAHAQESVVERYAQKIVDAQAKLDELKERFVIEQEQLEEEIFRRVKNLKAAAILIRRYVYGELFKVIAIDLGYTEESTYYFHREGRKEFFGTAKLAI